MAIPNVVCYVRRGHVLRKEADWPGKDGGHTPRRQESRRNMNRCDKTFLQQMVAQVRYEKRRGKSGAPQAGQAWHARGLRRSEANRIRAFDQVALASCAALFFNRHYPTACRSCQPGGIDASFDAMRTRKPHAGLGAQPQEAERQA